MRAAELARFARASAFAQFLLGAGVDGGAAAGAGAAGAGAAGAGVAGTARPEAGAARPAAGWSMKRSIFALCISSSLYMRNFFAVTACSMRWRT